MTLPSFNEINSFFWDMSVVNQHELREPNVCPENTKGENEFSGHTFGMSRKY